MGNTVKLRKVYEPDDEAPDVLQRIDGLDRLIFYDCEPYPHKADSHWWAVVDSGEWVGFAGLRDMGDGIGYLCRAGIIGTHRGRGLQRRMINARLRAARSLGMSIVVTDTATTNPASANNLYRCGFKVYTPANQWRGPLALYFRRELD